MTAELQAEIDAAFAVRLGEAAGAAVADKIGGLLARPARPPVPAEVAFPDKADMVLTLSQPDHARALGPLLGWCWQVTRVQINGATAGSYTVYSSVSAALAGAPQDALPGPGGTAPNTFWEPRGLFLRYGEKLTAVGTGVTTAGIMRAEFVVIREDWLASYIM